MKPALIIPWAAIGLHAQQKFTPAEQELPNLFRETQGAYLKSNSATVNRIEGEDFLVFTGTSRRSAALKPLKKDRKLETRSDETKARLAATEFHLEAPMVRIMGDFAIINAIYVQTGKNSSGVDSTGKSYLTGVWAKREGI